MRDVQNTSQSFIAEMERAADSTTRSPPVQRCRDASYRPPTRARDSPYERRRRRAATTQSAADESAPMPAEV